MIERLEQPNSDADRSSPAARYLGEIVALLLVIGLFWPARDVSETMAAAMDLAHGPLFALLAFVLCRRRGGNRPSIGLALRVLGVLVAFGAATELGQETMGRSASLGDFAADAAGALCGVTLAMVTASRSVVRTLAACVFCLAIFVASNWHALEVLRDACWLPFAGPKLAGFETEMEKRRWRGHQAKFRRVREFATEGEYSMQVVLEPGEHPFVALRRLRPNWLEYDTLEFDVLLERPTRLLVKIQDRENLRTYDDLFVREFVWNAGVQHVAISLGDVEKAPKRGLMQMDQIALLQFQAIHVKRDVVFYLDNIRLR